jgi:hypothetical protein
MFPTFKTSISTTFIFKSAKTLEIQIRHSCTCARKLPASARTSSMRLKHDRKATRNLAVMLSDKNLVLEALRSRVGPTTKASTRSLLDPLPGRAE